MTDGREVPRKLGLPIDPENIHTELEQIEGMVRAWREQIGQGLPGIDVPAADGGERLELLMQQFVGELMFVSGKCQNMALVLAER